ncbi:MAG: hypothetical protein ABEK59_08815 [Halobacteria archaeon]
MKLRGFVFTVILIVSLVALAGVSTASPPRSPDHGINKSTFEKLWSGTNGSSSVGTGDSTFTEALTSSSDYTFEKPPAAVEKWNLGDIRDFNHGNWRSSIYPGDTNLTDSDVRNNSRVDDDWLTSFGGIKDAYVRIFSADPSTVLHLSGNETRRYVGRSGKVAFATDFRVVVPNINKPNICSFGFPNRNRQRFVNVEDVELKAAGGQVLDSSSGDYSGVLSYDSLPRNTKELVVSANLSMKWRVEKPGQSDPGDCSIRADERPTIVQNVHVTDSVEVVPYRFGRQLAARSVKYPDGKDGMFVFSRHPWVTVSFGNHGLHSRLWFYTARDKDWDKMFRSTDTGRSASISSTQPLETYAYPSDFGVTTMNDSDASIKVEEVIGKVYPPPVLPPDITVNVATHNYTLSNGVALKLDEPYTGDVNITGLVRGAQASPKVAEGGEVIHRSNLSLKVLERNLTQTKLQVSLRENGTGKPIKTTDTSGKIEIMGEKVNTSKNGNATVTVDSPQVPMLTARYVPEPWWDSNTAYLGDTASVSMTQDNALGNIVGMFMDFVGIMIPFLILIYLLDGMLNLGVWPPWRDLW